MFGALPKFSWSLLHLFPLIHLLALAIYFIVTKHFCDFLVCDRRYVFGHFIKVAMLSFGGGWYEIGWLVMDSSGMC